MSTDGEAKPDVTATLLALVQQQQKIQQEQQEQNAKLLQTLADLQIQGGPRAAAPLPQLKPVPVPKLASPDSLTPSHLRTWITKWNDHFQTAQLSLQALPAQQAILRSALADEWITLWNAGRLSIDDTSDISTIIGAIELYIRKRRNPLLDRHEFHCRDQQAGETIDQYYARLRSLDDASAHDMDIACPRCSKTLSATCQDPNCDFNDAVDLFPLLQEARIRDRLLCGLHNKELQSKLLGKMQDHHLTTDEIISKGMAMEHADTASARLQNAQSDVMAIKQSAFKKQQSRARSPVPSTSVAAPLPPRTSNSSPLPPKQTRCLNCGGYPHTNRAAQCPAFNHWCSTCPLRGHFEEMCFRTHPELNPKRRNLPSASHSSRQHSANSVQINSMHAGSDQTLLPIEISCGDYRGIEPFLCDTGSDADIMGYETFKRMCARADIWNLLDRTNSRLVSASNTRMKVYGKVYVIFTFNGYRYATDLFIVHDVRTCILSKTGCERLGLLPHNWPHAIAPTTTPTVKAISKGKRVSFAISPVPDAETLHISAQLLEEFKDVFDDTVLKPMVGPPMKIQLIEGAQPCKKYKAYSVPIHWQKPVKSQLESMVAKGVIEPVPVGEPYDWCHPMVVVPKKGSNEPRITVDLTGLNKFVRRPAYPTRVPREVVARIPPGQKYFTTLDARHGYWQIPLEEESKKLTTFLTPWGSYRFCRNVMGLISAGDEHNRRGDEAIAGISNVEKIVEDILLFDTNLNDHTQRVRTILERCRRHGITLNKTKFSFAKPATEWCGFNLNEAGYTPAPHLVEALQHFPVPTTKTDIRSFHGLVQQFEAFSPYLAELALPLRALLPKDAAFVWETPHQRAFDAIRKELASPRILTHFSPGQPLRLETDAAQSKGLGFALWQQQKDGSWKLLQASSRAVTPTESNYCATEIELLAVTWAVRKCRLFLLGQSFQLIVDHRPLVSIINSKTLDQIENPRIQRLKEKLLLYSIEAVWRPGTKHTIVDVFSRFPVGQPIPEDAVDEADPVQIMAVSFSDPQDASVIIPDKTLEGVREAALSSPSYQKLKQLVLQSDSDKHHWDDDVSSFFQHREQLTVLDSLIFYGTRLVVPRTLRPHILQLLHASHQGETRMMRRAMQAVFWPGIKNDIQNVVRTCQPCQTLRPSQPKEPLISEPLPQYPFQVVGVDFFSYGGYEYLVVVDRYSGWPAVSKMGASSTTQQLITALVQLFTDTGIPAVLISDNGPQFASLEFKQWCSRWGIHHRTSSPHHPQSNGLAEAAVKAMKHLLTKTSPKGDIRCEEFRLGMLEFKNTPRADGYSPAQLVLGAPLRGLIPLHHSHYARPWIQQQKDRDQKAEALRRKAQEQYDRTAHPLAELAPGDIVYVQNPTTLRWDTIAEILEKLRPRSYRLRTEAGRVLHRNRRHLRPCHSTIPAQPVSSNVPVLRRSTRQRRPPQRPLDEFFRDPRSLSAGGHGTRLPRNRQQRPCKTGAKEEEPNLQNEKEKNVQVSPIRPTSPA